MNYEGIKKFAKTVKEAHGISHGHALEKIARYLGFKDWNTMSALARESVFPDVTIDEMRKALDIKVGEECEK